MVLDGNAIIFVWSKNSVNTLGHGMLKVILKLSMK